MSFNLNDTTTTFGNAGKNTPKLDKRELKTPSMIGEDNTTFLIMRKNLKDHSW